MKVLDLSTTLRADVSPFNKAMDSSASSATSSFNRIAQAGMSALGGAGLLKAYSRAAKAANAFGQSLADISAITDLNIEKIGNSIRKLPNYLGDMEKVANTMYEIISSGFRDIDESALVEFQKAISISARVIRADVYNTGNAITTLANAYKMSMSDIIGLQDWFYLTVREGKAHGDELARTLGLVVNNASEAGIELNELGAAISILSRTQSTSQSMIGLNQMINSLIKPTLRAQAEARKWGIELGASALEAKGLTTMLTELNEKVGGNVEALEKMFGNIRAGRAVLSLTGKQFKDYIQVLGEYDKGGGSGMKALQKQVDTAQQDFTNLQVQVGKTWEKIGKDIEPVSRLLAQVAEASLKGFGNTTVVNRYVLYIGILYTALQKIVQSFKAINTGVENISNSMSKMASKAQMLNASTMGGSNGVVTTAMMKSYIKSQLKDLKLQKTAQILTSTQISAMVSRHIGGQFSLAKNGSIRHNLTGKFTNQATVDAEAVRQRGYYAMINNITQSRIQQQIDDLTRLSKNISSGNLFDKYQDKLSKINKQDTLTSFMLKLNPSFTKMEAMAKRNVEARYRQDMGGNWYDPLKKGHVFIDYQKAVNEEQARILKSFAQTRKDFEAEVQLRRELFLKAKKGQRLDRYGATSQERFERRHGGPAWYSPRGLGRNIGGFFKGSAKLLATSLSAWLSAISVAELGVRIGMAIGEKLNLAELFKSSKTKQIEQEMAQYNVQVIRDRLQKETLSSKLLTEQQKLEIMGSATLAKTQDELNAILKQKVAMEKRSLKVIEKNNGITEQSKNAEARLNNARKEYAEALEFATNSKDMYITPEALTNLPKDLERFVSNARVAEEKKEYDIYGTAVPGLDPSVVPHNIQKTRKVGSEYSLFGIKGSSEKEVREALQKKLMNDPVIKGIMSQGGFSLAKLAPQILGSTDSFKFGDKTYSGDELAALKATIQFLQKRVSGGDLASKETATMSNLADKSTNLIKATINNELIKLTKAVDTLKTTPNFEDVSDVINQQAEAYELLASGEAHNVLRQHINDIQGELDKLDKLHSEVTKARSNLLTKSNAELKDKLSKLPAEQQKQVQASYDAMIKSTLASTNDVVDANLKNMRIQRDNLLRYRDRLAKAESKVYYDKLLKSMQSVDPLVAMNSMVNSNVSKQVSRQTQLQNDINKLRANSLKVDKDKRAQIVAEIQRKEIDLSATKQNLTALNELSRRVNQEQRAKIELQKATGKITESQAIQQELSLERTRINSINIQLGGVKRMTEEYYNLTEQRMESEKRIAGLNTQLEEKIMARNKAIMDTTQDFTREKDDTGRLTSNALYHSLNLMARLTPNMGGFFRSSGISTISSLSASNMNISSPRAAQNAQNRLADAMDAYITQQKYQSVSMSDNVKKIVDILSKDTPIRLN